MKINTSINWRAGLAKMIVAALLVVAVVFIPTYTAQAAKAPTISKKSVNIMLKETYDLNIKNKIAGSTYEWVSSDVKIATVDAAGLVRGKTRGDVVITCKITAADKKVYTVSSKVRVVSGAKEFAINNKVAVLNQGQVYDVNRTLTPVTSNDVTTWTSSDTTIAKPDKNGKFTALKIGTVTITGTTLSGKTDSMTVKVIDAAGTVTTQAELEALLAIGAPKVTISTTDTVTIKVPAGEYLNTTLIVDAPKADIYNYGVFKSIEIYKIAANTWHEEVKGNEIMIFAGDSRVIVGENASVSIEVVGQQAKVTIVNNGVVSEIIIDDVADIAITGNSTKEVPVTVKSSGTTVTSSVPLAVTASAPMTLTLQPGAEKSTVAADKKENVPTIIGKVTIDVTVGVGNKAVKQEVKGEEVKEEVIKDPAAPFVPAPAPTDNTPVPEVGKVYYSDGRVQYILSRPYTELKAIAVSYKGINYNLTSTTLDLLKFFLANETFTMSFWNGAIDNIENIYDGQTVVVNGPAGGTKTVTFKGGSLNGKSYTVTVSSDHSVTVTSGTGLSFTLKKISEKTLEISKTESTLVFDPTFN